MTESQPVRYIWACACAPTWVGRDKSFSKHTIYFKLCVTSAGRQVYAGPQHSAMTAARNGRTRQRRKEGNEMREGTAYVVGRDGIRRWS